MDDEIKSKINNLQTHQHKRKSEEGEGEDVANSGFVSVVFHYQNLIIDVI